ncbi:Similar to SMYD4: SET and MYND domain-containing protein 4 (Pongo abelii) [Cotesia congregata]|uniref:Similar to SMYD4: SET and MYND domain-containing protein 4 (Pongo abelii) n=1 Tax=Cotesia congregata TaxID=51543 RepID=A0A8J2H6E5_COTCN|nr:Similar to SMYD4: SET and MYND domain-containing protein 4 (Pongo abelii) [Cotesia congregata]
MYLESLVQMRKKNFYDYDITSPEEVEKLMLWIFTIINVIGNFDVYPCEQISVGKGLLHCIIKWIEQIYLQFLHKIQAYQFAARLLKFAYNYNLSKLLDYIYNFIDSKANEVINTPECQTFITHAYATEHFSDAKTDEDFIKVALKIHGKKEDELPNLSDIKKPKCEVKAKQMLDKAKRGCSSISLGKSIEVYNTAMSLALPGSELLAHAYANRSIVLSNAAMYEESLKDIEQALKANYPDHLKALLFARKAKNLFALDPTADIKDTLNEARQWALKMNDKEKKKLLDNLEKIKKKKYKKPVKERDNRILMPLPHNDNPIIKDTSGSITINYSEKFGRHIVATKDMMVGEVVSVKQAYALVLSWEYRLKRCWNCSKHCWSSVPCNTCSNVIYCSEECRNVAWKDYHGIECSILTGLLSLAHHYEDISLMSLRLFIKAIKEFGTVKALYKNIQKMDSTEDFIMKSFTDGIYDDKKYASVYPLSRKPMNLRFQVQCAVKTIHYMYLMALMTDIFGKKMENMEELRNYEHAVFVGKLLYHHTVLSSSNRYAIPVPSTNEQLECGGVLNPLESLFNHSCDANTGYFLCRDMSTFMTLQPIKKGEQLFISYGPEYHEVPTPKRREELQKIQNFWCDCQACINNWNPGHVHPSIFDKLPATIVTNLSLIFLKCICQIQEQNFYDYDTTSPEEIQKLLLCLFTAIHLVGYYEINITRKNFTALHYQMDRELPINRLIHLMDKFVTLSMHALAVDHLHDAKTDEDFVKIALKMHAEQQDELPNLNDIKKPKCEVKAKGMLDKAKRGFSSSSLGKTIEVYNTAMSLALPGSELLAHAYANRSIVLSNAAMYKESLKDIEHALKANYPDNMKALLFARKAKNLFALDPTADIENTLNEARQWALKMNDKEKNKLLDNLEKLKTKTYKKPVKERDNRIFVPSPPNDNPIINDTSAAIAINYSEKFGRHIVATRDMMAGEVVSVKRAYALVIACDYRFKLCWNCSKYCWSSVPCNTCSNVIYCSEECRNVAWKDYHDIECSILNGLFTSIHYYDDIGLMSLRLFIKAMKEFETIYAPTKGELLYCGGILDPLESLYNHSCDPNMGYFLCRDKTTTFITLQPIKKGEQLFISYGPDFHEMPTPERRELLQNDRSFWCDCHACINNWNSKHVFPSAWNKLPKTLATKMSMILLACIVHMKKQNFNDLDTTPPEEVKKLMSDIFTIINVVGRYDIYPCDEISVGKSLLHCIIKWIENLRDKLVMLKIDLLAAERFSGAKTDEDFVRAALKMHVEQQDELPKLKDIKKPKCEVKAKLMLDEAKQGFSSISLGKTVEVYNTAMSLALPGSELLAHAFANRSIVLSNAAMYEESLKDIEHALKANYPDNMKASLFARKAKNLFALDPTADIEDTLNEARQWALKMNDKEKNKLLDNLEKLKTKTYKKPVKERDNRIFVPSPPNDNPKIKDTSAAIAINYSEKFGRHIVATRDMMAGEVVSVKRAYALVLSCDYRFKLCWNCSKHCWSSVPCNTCSDVIYCSEECRNVAWKDYHDIECSIVNGLLSSVYPYEDISLTSLRLFIKAIKEFGTVKALYESVQKMDSKEDFIMKSFTDGIYDDKKYASIYSLCRKPMDTRFQVQCAGKTLQYMYFIALTSNIFGKKMENMDELANYEYAVFVGKLLYHHTVLSCNNRYAVHDSTNDELVDCGGLLSSLQSFFNHNCDPNTDYFVCRGMTTFITLQPIKKGEQLFISYGPEFHEVPTPKRREELQNIRNFWCDCHACINNWNPGHVFPSAWNKVSKPIATSMSMMYLESLVQMRKKNFYDYDITSPEEVEKLMLWIFTIINVIGNFDVYPCEQISVGKGLLHCIIKWIELAPNLISEFATLKIDLLATEHFSGAKTDEDFVRAALKMHVEEQDELPNLRDMKKPTCEVEAKRMLNKAKQDSSIHNTAMSLALPGSELLAHAFANRSIVLSNAAMYEESLKNIEHALNANYPDNMKVLLFARKAKSLFALDPTADIEDTLNEARQWALKMSDKEKNKLLDNLEKLKTKTHKIYFDSLFYLKIFLSADSIMKSFTDGIYDDKKYASVYPLRRRPMTTRIKVQCARKALQYMYFMALTSDVFGKKMKNMDELKNYQYAVFVGKLLYHHTVLSSTNRYAIHVPSTNELLKCGGLLNPLESLRQSQL